MSGGRGGLRGRIRALLPVGTQGSDEDPVRGQGILPQAMQGDIQILRLAPRQVRIRDGFVPRRVQEREAVQGTGSQRPLGRTDRILPRKGLQVHVLHIQGDGGLPHICPSEGQRRQDHRPRLGRQHREGLRADRGRDREQMHHSGPGDLCGQTHRHREVRERNPDHRQGGLCRCDSPRRQGCRPGRLRVRGGCEERRTPRRYGYGHAAVRTDRRQAARQLLPGCRKRYRRDIRVGGVPEAHRGWEVRRQAAEAPSVPEPSVHPHGQGLERRPSGDPPRGPRKGEGGRVPGLCGGPYQPQAPPIR